MLDKERKTLVQILENQFKMMPLIGIAFDNISIGERLIDQTYFSEDD